MHAIARPELFSVFADSFVYAVELARPLLLAYGTLNSCDCLQKERKEKKYAKGIFKRP